MDATPVPFPAGALDVGEWQVNKETVTRTFRGKSIRVSGIEARIEGRQAAYPHGEVLDWGIAVGYELLSFAQAEELIRGLSDLVAEGQAAVKAELATQMKNHGFREVPRVVA
ncbi:hypothetical protein [Mycobacterium sp. E342]|uniref:hypothetical protein n=1 Tax=Mycobacterium sp. E342 TaxID=1834147 RepID=UPI000AB5EB94|nr:hypothetical protein [Mycobacterium sp. E342]